MDPDDSEHPFDRANTMFDFRPGLRFGSVSCFFDLVDNVIPSATRFQAKREMVYSCRIQYVNVKRQSSMGRSVMFDLFRIRFVRNLLIGGFVRSNQILWSNLPRAVTNLGPMRAYGRWLNALVRRRPIRMSYFYTSFFRNRPLLELAYRLSDQKRQGSSLTISVLGCSIGAEVYSLLWTIRSRRPDLKVVVNAVDISKEALKFAQEGVYTQECSQFTDAAVLASVTKHERVELFDNEGDMFRIKPWLKEGINWRLGNAADPKLVDVMGPQDMVFANNLLCHMYSWGAERCLRNVASLVMPGGYLFVSGIDLAIRTGVARAHRLEPVTDLIEEIHNGDLTLITDWPFKYWGLEPFSIRRHDWRERYSSVFRVSGLRCHESNQETDQLVTCRKARVSGRIGIGL